MLIAYDSRTGNVARFIAKLDGKVVRINEASVLAEPFVLITYTTGFGQVPESTAAFLRKNSRWLRGVAASGNRNWGDGFAKSADRIADDYRVPVLGKFELSGTSREVQQFQDQLNRLTVKIEAAKHEAAAGTSVGGAG